MEQDQTKTNINWYPGHMTKAWRQMQEDIRLIDLVIELVDARTPQSSRNPDIDRLGQGKARLVLLNKADLADEEQTEQWITYFRAKGYQAVAVNSQNSGGLKSINSAVQEACREKLERNKRRGILNRPLRAMVVGIPNVGKSTFINAYAKRACAKTGNKPGVTKGKQWIKLSNVLELLDTPGILWPKFEDQAVAVRLALIGSIRDDILNLNDLALQGIRQMQTLYPGRIAKRYEITEEQEAPAVLEGIADSRKCRLKGDLPDYDKASAIFLNDLRNGKLGRLTLEHCAQTL